MPHLHRPVAALLLTLAFLCAAQPRPAHAWGDDGHKVVAEIAARFLSPAAKSQLTALLAADTDTLTARDIANRATWADRFRDSDRNTTQVRYKATRQWHFVDLELKAPDLAKACFGHPRPAGPASQGPADSCVVDKIEQFAAELRQLKGTAPERLLALKFLLHFMGDLHQPLHAADNADKGGNEVAILFGAHTVAQNLHGYWDVETVRRIGTNPATIAATLATTYRTRFAEWSKGTPRDWAQQSFEAAHKVAYNLPMPMVPDAHGKPAHRLDAAYEAAAEATAREQLARAGMRLAAVLNAALR